MNYISVENNFSFQILKEGSITKNKSTAKAHLDSTRKGDIFAPGKEIISFNVGFVIE